MKKILSRKVFEIDEKYGNDLGLLDEPWASQKDRKKVSPEQTHLLGEYLDAEGFLKARNLAKELRESSLQREKEIENVMEPELLDLLRGRL